MKHLTIRTFTFVAFFAVTSSLLWWRSHAAEEATASAGTMSTSKFQTRIGAKKLPNEEIEDMALVYPSAPKRWARISDTSTAARFLDVVSDGFTSPTFHHSRGLRAIGSGV
jgi:hypothetical protein